MNTDLPVLNDAAKPWKTRISNATQDRGSDGRLGGRRKLPGREEQRGVEVSDQEVAGRAGNEKTGRSPQPGRPQHHQKRSEQLTLMRRRPGSSRPDYGRRFEMKRYYEEHQDRFAYPKGTS